MPANSCILLRTPEEARAFPRGDIALAFCRDCGFVTNRRFDERVIEYSGRYEESQAFSETFNRFHQRLASRLVERYGLHGKRIVEIGCGKGEFLALLCEMGPNAGVGFDPGAHPERTHGAAAERIRFVADYFDERYADERADFVCCKMTLEHIPAVAAFLATLRRAVASRPGTVLYFLVPESARILRECAFEDVFYEHCSYFSPPSMASLFARAGFEVLAVGTEYGGQYLQIEARSLPAGAPVPRLPDDGEAIAELASAAAEFALRVAARRAAADARLRAFADAGRKVVLWGAQSKAVAVMSALSASSVIRCGVDINPYRQGHYLPGSALPIVAPAHLVADPPDVVLVMNPVYRDEIGRDLDALGLRPELLTLADLVRPETDPGAARG